MAIDESLISTGVDNLIKLVYARGRIKLVDTSKELGISISVLEEWAKVLEEEGILRIEYQLTTAYLVWAGTPYEKTGEKQAEIAETKLSLTRELDGLLASMKGAGDDLKESREKLSKLPSMLDTRFGEVQSQMQLTRKFEAENKKLLKEAESKASELDKRLKKMESGISSVEERSKEFVSISRDVQVLFKDVESKKSSLEKEISDIRSDMRKLETLKEKYRGMKGSIDALDSKLSSLNKQFQNISKKTDTLHEFKNSLKGSEKEIREDLGLIRKERSNALNELAESRKKLLEESEKAGERAKKFLEESEKLIDQSGLKKKREEIEGLLNVLEEASSQHKELQRKLSMLSIALGALPSRPTPEIIP